MERNRAVVVSPHENRWLVSWINLVQVGDQINHTKAGMVFDDKGAADYHAQQLKQVGLTFRRTGYYGYNDGYGL